MKALTFLILGIFAFSIARADGSTKTDEDWNAAAKAAIDHIEHRQPLKLVLGKGLPPQAQAALKHWRTAIVASELPEQEKYTLPAGYIRIQKFEDVPSGFDVVGTTGPIPKGALLNCGVTRGFVVAKGTDGAWKPTGMERETVC